MDNKNKYTNIKILKTVESLEKNNMKAYYIQDKMSYFKLLSDLINEGDTVSVGGSMTLFETETIAWLRGQNITFLDRYAEGLFPEDIRDIYVKSFDADVYLSSSNAVTQTGNLYNVDGRGNRVAAMIYGPKKVIVVVGSNKIVADDDAAILRNRQKAAPINAMRLDRKTPCTSLGYCTDCDSSERICSAYVFLRKQMIKNRIHVIIMDEALGY